MMKTRNLGAPPPLTTTLMECGDTASVRKPNRNHRNLGNVRNHNLNQVHYDKDTNTLGFKRCCSVTLEGHTGSRLTDHLLIVLSLH